MMLTPEQMAGYREQANGIGAFAELLAHIDAQQARIAELESKAESLQQSLHLLMDKAVELEQDAARYRSICRDVASEWGNFAGAADECLRRIEAYEQSKETP